MANTTADKLAKLAETKSNIKQAIIDKGVSVSDTDTFASYAGKIGQIQSGGGIPNYIAPKNNVDGVYKPDNTATSFSLNGATDIDLYALYGDFDDCSNLKSVDLSSLTTISTQSALQYCFRGCTGLTSVSFPSLTTISGGSCLSNCFYNCFGLTSVDFPALTTISGNNALNTCFYGCTGLTSVSFPVLTTLSGNGSLAFCFSYCTNLTEIRFPALQSLGKPLLQFNNMLQGVSGCTLHFPSNMQSEVERRTGYPDFGGTDTVVLFDLPPTTTEA